MTQSELYWLPECDDFPAALKELNNANGSAAEIFANLQNVACTKLSFLQSRRVDQVALRHLRRDTHEAIGWPRIKLAIVASSSIDHLIPSIRVAGLRRGIIIDCYLGAYGQLSQEILDQKSGLHEFSPDAILISIDAQSAVEQIQLQATAEEVKKTINTRVKELKQLWDCARNSLNAIIIQQTIIDRNVSIFGNFDLHVPGAPRTVSRQFNHEIIENAVANGILLADFDWWAGELGRRHISDLRLWHHAKQEISPSEAPLFGDLIARQLAAIRGLTRKCLILDLDNTLWGGVVGEDGLQGIVLGQGSALGEAYLSFQRYVKNLSDRGIILAVSSKNDKNIARSVFRDHPEMVLREPDIAVFEASWDDKPLSVQRIARKLNLGLDAVVFFDDNPAERALMRQTIKSIAVPEPPDAVERYGQSLSDAGYFETISFTSDDARRAEQYAANVKRQEIQSAAPDLDTFLRNLEMECDIYPFETSNLPRIAQLINKTNQFNLTSKRYTETEIAKLLQEDSVMTYFARLSDRYGDNGIISVVIGRLRQDDNFKSLEIDTWLMSCRVFGRRVEDEMFRVLLDAAQTHSATHLVGVYRPTKRNGLVRDFYPNLGFERFDSADKLGNEHRWILKIDQFTPTKSDLFKRITVHEK